MREQGEGAAHGEEKIFCDQEEDVPHVDTREMQGEKVLEDFEEVCREKEEEIDGDDDC